MPLAGEPNILGKVQCQLDGGEQRLRVAEVRSLVKVNACERQMILFAETRRFENLGARHAELAIVLSCLGVRVMGMNGDARDEAQPKVYVTLSGEKSLVRKRREILPVTDPPGRCRFAHDGIDSLEFAEIINNDCPRVLNCRF